MKAWTISFSKQLLYPVWLQLCSVELLFPEIKFYKVYFIPKFQGKKSIFLFQLKQENLLLAKMLNLNSLWRNFFPIFVQKQLKGSTTLNCSCNSIQIQY